MNLRKIVNSFGEVVLNWQWVLLFIAAPFLLFPNPQRSLVLLIVPVLWLTAWSVKKKPLPITPLNGPLLLLLIMVLVSLYATYDIEVSLPKISGVILGFGMFFAFYSVTEAKRSILIPLALFLGTGLGISIFGILGLQQFQKIGFLQPLVNRLPLALTNLPGAEGGFHPNEIAGAILWVLPMLFVLYGFLFVIVKKALQVISKGQFLLISILVFLALAFVSFEFLLTQSRTGWVALFFTLILLSLLIIPSRFRLLGFLGSLVLLALAGWFAWDLGWIQRLYEVTTFGGTSDSVLTLNGRVEIWSRALYGIQDFPFTGMGMNTFRNILPILYPLFTISPEFDVGHAHNEFLQAALDLGIPGLIAFIAIYLVSFQMLLQVWQSSLSHRFSRNQKGLDLILLSPQGIKALVLGIGLSLFAHALFGLTDAVALGAKPGILYWMLLGLTASLHGLVCGDILIKK